MAVQPASRDRYHHGDARQALLEAAGALLEDMGAAGISLRQVAERAGLSRQAPYNHFADKADLLAAVARGGFARLAQGLRGAADSAAPPPARLQMAGAAYIGFAWSAPALFRLMFSAELVDWRRNDPETRVSAACHDALVRIVAGMAPPERVDDVSLTAWSLVHGYATLCLETGVEDASRVAERASVFAAAVSAWCAGMR